MAGPPVSGSAKNPDRDPLNIMRGPTGHRKFGVDALTVEIKEMVVILMAWLLA